MHHWLNLTECKRASEQHRFCWLVQYIPDDERCTTMILFFSFLLCSAQLCLKRDINCGHPFHIAIFFLVLFPFFSVVLHSLLSASLSLIRSPSLLSFTWHLLFICWLSIIVFIRIIVLASESRQQWQRSVFQQQQQQQQRSDKLNLPQHCVAWQPFSERKHWEQNTQMQYWSRALVERKKKTKKLVVTQAIATLPQHTGRERDTGHWLAALNPIWRTKRKREKESEGKEPWPSEHTHRQTDRFTWLRWQRGTLEKEKEDFKLI